MNDIDDIVSIICKSIGLNIMLLLWLTATLVALCCGSENEFRPTVSMVHPFFVGVLADFH